MDIIDAHVHIGLQSFIKHPPGEDRSKKHGISFQLWNEPGSVLHSMDSLEIDKAVIFPFPFEEIDLPAANDYILWCCRTFPGRFLPVGLIEPELPSKKNSYKFMGFKQHTVYQNYSPEDLGDAYQFMSDHGLVLFVHLPFNDKISYVKRILAVAPNLRIVVAHMGRKRPGSSTGAEEVLTELSKYENIMFETSTVRDPDFFIKAISIVGEDRICFGSDCPFGSAGDVQAIISEELELILKSTLHNTVKEKILARNITCFLFG